MIRALLAAASLLFLGSPAALAGEAIPMAEDPVLEARLMDLADELRCLVCQNQTLADSDADLAVDLRNEIRSMMKRDMGNDQIIDFMVQRYGDFVLYRPPFKPETLLLWFGPGALIAIAAVMWFTTLRRRHRGEVAAPLSKDERRRLQRLTQEKAAQKANGDGKA